MPRSLLVNTQTNIVENIIVPWVCPEGYEEIENDTAQIGWVKQTDGTFVRNSEQQAAYDQEQAALAQSIEDHNAYIQQLQKSIDDMRTSISQVQSGIDAINAIKNKTAEQIAQLALFVDAKNSQNDKLSQLQNDLNAANQ